MTSGRKSRIASNIGWNFASGIASIFGLLLLYPLSVRIAGAEAYGIWVLAFGAIQLFTLADFGLGTGIVRTLSAIHPSEVSHIERREFVTVAGTMFLALSLVLTLSCLVFFSHYLYTIPMTGELRKMIPVVVAIASGCLFVSVIGRFANSALWAEDRPDIERKASLAGLALRAIGLALGLGLGYEFLYVVLVEAVSIALPSLICTVVVAKKYGWPRFSRRAFKLHIGPLIRVSSALFVGTFASVAASQVPLYIVGSSLGLTATTAFGALLRAFQSAKLAVSWLTNPFTHLMVDPSRSEKMVRGAAKSCIQLTLAAALLISIPLITIPSQILEVWMGEGYVFASSALAVVAVSVMSNSLILPSALITTLKSNPWPTSVMGLIVLGLTVTTVSIGVQTGSVFWAALGLVTPLAVTAPAYLVLAHRVIDLRFSRRELLLPALMVVVAGLLGVITCALSEILNAVQAVGAYALLAAGTGAIGLAVKRKLASSF